VEKGLMEFQDCNPSPARVAFYLPGPLRGPPLLHHVQHPIDPPRLIPQG